MWRSWYTGEESTERRRTGFPVCARRAYEVGIPVSFLVSFSTSMIQCIRIMFCGVFSHGFVQQHWRTVQESLEKQPPMSYRHFYSIRSSSCARQLARSYMFHTRSHTAEHCDISSHQCLPEQIDIAFVPVFESSRIWRRDSWLRPFGSRERAASSCRIMYRRAWTGLHDGGVI